MRAMQIPSSHKVTFLDGPLKGHVVTYTFEESVWRGVCSELNVTFQDPGLDVVRYRTPQLMVEKLGIADPETA